eukprot:9184134-Ditylum_brightwellii.AAC.2
MAVLQRVKETNNSHDIRCRIEHRLDLWEAEEIDQLVEDTTATARRQLPANQHQETEAHVTKTFVNILFQGKLRQAVRCLTSWEKGGLLSLNNRCTKLGEVVSEVLRSKHPDPVELQVEALQAFPHVSAFMNVNVTASVVEKVAWKLSGAAGPDGVHVVTMADWLLRYGVVSHKLREVIAKCARWVGNTFPSWAALCAFVSSCLIGLDKCPGTQPVDIGGILLRLVGKSILSVGGEEVKTACGANQLCSGLRAGIEGGIHMMGLLWEEFGEEEGWGILLVDAWNAFNELNHKAMLWHVHHYWPSGCQYAFNIYWHWKISVFQGTEEVVFSKEGVTQGDPMAMFLYALGVLPIILQLKHHQQDIESLNRIIERLQA